MLLLFGGLMLLCRSKKEAVRTGVLLGFLVAAVFPIAAVGYYTGGTRLRYIVGIFFYAAVAQALSAVMKRRDSAWLIRLWAAVTVLFVLGFTVWGAGRFDRFADDGRCAYACMQAVTLQLYDETDGKPPKRIEWCGASNKVDEFQVVNQSSLPYAPALKYGTKAPIPVEEHKQCGKKRKPFFAPSACANPIWYRIVSK